jgi:K+-sensing histidine kinase KdpD
MKLLGPNSHPKTDDNILVERKKSLLRFMVIDSGKGITKDRQKSIFNLFEHNQNISLKESFKKKTCKLHLDYKLIL